MTTPNHAAQAAENIRLSGGTRWAKCSEKDLRTISDIQTAIDAATAELREKLELAEIKAAGLQRGFDVGQDCLRKATAERDELRRQVEALKRSEDQLLTERDEAEEWADRLAGYAGDIGEHSNANNPWENACELFEQQQAERDALKQQLEQARAECAQMRQCLERFRFDRAALGLGVPSEITNALNQSTHGNDLLAELRELGAVYEAASAEILGKPLHVYLREQYPATIGHIPLRDYIDRLFNAIDAAKQKEGQ